MPGSGPKAGGILRISCTLSPRAKIRMKITLQACSNIAERQIWSSFTRHYDLTGALSLPEWRRAARKAHGGCRRLRRKPFEPHRYRCLVISRHIGPKPTVAGLKHSLSFKPTRNFTTCAFHSSILYEVFHYALLRKAPKILITQSCE